MDTPLVSIVIPLYNYSRFINDCLESCTQQRYDNVEILVIDDKSTDDGAQKVKDWRKKDRRVKLLRHKWNQGYSAAKNTGIIAANGEMIVHLDADDMLTPKSITKRLAAFTDDIDMVHGTARNFQGNHTYAWCLQKNKTLEVNPKVTIHAQGVMIRRACYEKYGLYDEELRAKADKEMWVRLREVAGITMVRLNYPVAYYRMHGKSMMAKRRRHPKHNQRITEAYDFLGGLKFTFIVVGLHALEIRDFKT